MIQLTKRIAMMIFTFSLLFIVWTRSAEAQINTISNLYKDQLLINVFHKKTQLLLFNPVTLESEKLPLPKMTNKEDIIGLFIFEVYPETSKLPKVKKEKQVIKLLIKQWTMGYGKPAQILKMANDSWQELGILDCISFDHITFLKNKINVQCEAEIINKKSKREVSMPVDFYFVKSQKFILPLSKQSSKQVKITLEGSVLSWDKIQIKKTGSKIPTEVKFIDL